MHWIPHTSKHKTTASSSFYTIYCQSYSDYKILVTGGGHLEFFHHKVDGKNETGLFQSFRVNISEKTQLIKIYMKNSQNDTMT